MSTTLAKPAEMADRKVVCDRRRPPKPLGRVAAKAAVILRGKNKTTFTPLTLTVVTACHHHHCDQAVLTGKKMEKRSSIALTRLIGGLKETQYKTPDG